MKKVRLNVYLKPATHDRISALAERLSMTKTGVAALAVEAGLDALAMSLDPQFRELFNRMAEHADYSANGRESPV